MTEKTDVFAFVTGLAARGVQRAAGHPRLWLHPAGGVPQAGEHAAEPLAAPRMTMHRRE
jgi:hypothetical protein